MTLCNVCNRLKVLTFFCMTFLVPWLTSCHPNCRMSSNCNEKMLISHAAAFLQGACARSHRVDPSQWNTLSNHFLTENIQMSQLMQKSCVNMHQKVAIDSKKLTNSKTKWRNFYNLLKGWGFLLYCATAQMRKYLAAFGLTSKRTIFSEMIPPISAIIETTTAKRKNRTRHGLSEAPPTHPIRPEKKRVKPSPMTTQVNIWKEGTKLIWRHMVLGI